MKEKEAKLARLAAEKKAAADSKFCFKYGLLTNVGLILIFYFIQYSNILYLN